MRNLIGFYEAGELVSIADFPQVTRVLDAFLGAAGGAARADDSCKIVSRFQGRSPSQEKAPVWGFSRV
ncbi:hypothetical protein JOS77_24095 [Chromobacterium haemolyticum]|nr:hypothetical protein JOS77_24095 [Chromobacterium haemolyticum]